MCGGGGGAAVCVWCWGGESVERQAREKRMRWRTLRFLVSLLCFSFLFLPQ